LQILDLQEEQNKKSRFEIQNGFFVFLYATNKAKS